MFLEKENHEPEVFNAAYLQHIHEDYKHRVQLSVPSTSSTAAKNALQVFAPFDSDNIPVLDHNEAAPVYAATVKGCTQSIRNLVENGADVNTPDACGTSPVAVAAGLGHTDALKTLLELGADFETIDLDSNTPVCIAALEGTLECIQVLAECGADVNAPGMHGWTPVMMAVQQGYDEVVEKLVDVGADVDIRGGIGETALDLAATSMNIDSAILLVNLGADISSYMETIALTSDIHDMFELFCQRCNVANCPKMYALFSLTKLMLSVQSNRDNSDDDDDENEIKQCQWEASVAHAFYEGIPHSTIEHIDHMSYDIRRRFVQIADRVYSDAQASDGVPPPSSRTRARRYVELVCLLFDEAMLRDVLALRLTCRANLEWRRFPVYSTACYHQLETNLIESYVAYDAVRFVTAHFIQGVIGIHALLHGD
jgi:hypothetical protein